MCNIQTLLQVLSESVANALERTGGNEVSETVKFVRNMDRFFDCLIMSAISPLDITRERFIRTHILQKMIFV